MSIRYGLSWRAKRRQLWQRSHVRMRTRHISGPKRFDLAENDVALIFLGRDIRYFLPAFFQHYRDLGIERFVYLDNGSRDGSEEFVANQPGTIVAQCDLNFRDYQSALRYTLANDFLSGGWRLGVDSDELLDYPEATRLSVPDLVGRLAERGHTGLVAQMLEMVPEHSLRAVSGLDFEASIQAFNRYSTDNVTAIEYHSDTPPLGYFLQFNTVADPGVKIMTGGLRRTLFGEDCMLTKHLLFKDAPTVLPFAHPHATCGLQCSDFTAVLKHYKFSGDYLEREIKRKAEKRLSHSEGETRLKALAEQGDIDFASLDLRQNPTVDDLIDQGFLFVSDQARRALLK